jgi:hypothetical protein
MPSENMEHRHAPEEEREFETPPSTRPSKRPFLRVIPSSDPNRMITRRWSAARPVMDEGRGCLCRVLPARDLPDAAR